MLVSHSNFTEIQSQTMCI